MRGRDDHDACYADHEYDTTWGDTIIASRREPCASPPVRQLDFEAIARRLKPVSPPLEPSTPAPASVLTAPETPEPPPLLRQQWSDALVGHAALPAQKLDFEAIELEPIESPSEPHAEPSVPAFRQADELRSVIRRHGYEVEQLLALTVSNAPHLQPSELLRLAVQWREARQMHDFERADELLALACHHGHDEHEFEKLSGVPPARRQMAAKQAKAKKMGSQLVVGSTILGRSIANDEPLYGGKCV